MRINFIKQGDFIDTSDLIYDHPDSRYIFNFQYLGGGVFYIDSKGYIDDKTFKLQLVAGDIARERLHNLFPDLKYHIIWNLSRVYDISLNTRHLILSKLKSTNNFGSINIVGANNFAVNLAKILIKIMPNINFSLFRTYEDALTFINDTYFPIDNNQHEETSSSNINRESTYLLFIKLWQESRSIYTLNNVSLKYYTKPEWNFESQGNVFSIKIRLIEGYIIYYELEGELKPIHIDKIYSILRDIIQEFKFSLTNKFISILNIKKITNISLDARKRTSYYEHIYSPYCEKVYAIPNYTLRLLIKTTSKINITDFLHWEILNSIEEALKKSVTSLKDDHFQSIQDNEKLENKLNFQIEIPGSKSGMIELIHNLHAQLIQQKEFQSKQIDKILEVTGRLTWDETWEPDENEDSENPFKEVFDSLSILYKDFRDIIKEKTLHAQQLVESEDKYKNLIELANDIITVYQDTTIRYVNSRVTQILGYTIEEVIGSSMDKFIVPEEIKRLEEFYKKRVLDENIPSVYETTVIHKTGLKIAVSMSVGKIIFYNKPAVMIIVRDISQKKKIEEELDRYRNHLEEIIRKRTEQLQKEISVRRVAEESDRLKTAFLSNMSHEIRTPMNAIIAFSDYLKNMDLSNSEKEEYLNYIQSSGQSLLNLINDIIDLSKIESKQIDIQISNVNINQLVDELYVLFEESRKNKNKYNIELKVKKDQDTQIYVNTDLYRLKQILSNLIDNALKFTDEGHIEFGYFLKQKDIIFYVRDTGDGIPNDKIDLIFKRFGRATTANKNISGTGLGLAISKNLATLLNGKLWVESKIGEGSTFYLKIPDYSITTIETPEQQEEKTSNNIQKFNWASRTILIAEDEDLNFRVLQIALSRTGAKIVRANNGREALELVNSEEKFDIVLMDIQMPEMDGYEAMSKIKQNHPNLPIIAQTAFALLEEKNRCIEIGFDDYIAKPIKLDDLFKKMEAQYEKIKQ